MPEEVQNRNGWVGQSRNEGWEKKKLGRETSLLTRRFAEVRPFRYVISPLAFLSCMGEISSSVWGEWMIPGR